MRVEVVYALREYQALVTVDLREGATAGEAVEHSGLLERFPDIGRGIMKLGIFGKAVDADAKVRDGDRVEIYRPLIADPKEARRRRARAAGKSAR